MNNSLTISLAFAILFSLASGATSPNFREHSDPAWGGGTVNAVTCDNCGPDTIVRQDNFTKYSAACWSQGSQEMWKKYWLQASCDNGHTRLTCLSTLVSPYTCHAYIYEPTCTPSCN